MASYSIPTPHSIDAHTDTNHAFRKRLEPFLSDSPINLFPPLNDEATWQRAFTKMNVRIPDLIAQGVAVIELGEFNSIPDELYLDYSISGNRVPFEKQLHKRLKDLQALILAECAERQGRFISPILQAIDTVLLKSPSWVLPAHDTNNATFLGKGRSIDLRSSMTAAWLTDILTIFGDRFPPTWRSRITQAIVDRVVDPVIASAKGERPSEFWMVFPNNWNAVCWGSCVRAVLGLHVPAADKIAVTAAALDNIHHYFKSFTPDGVSSEGVGYWNYGFLHYTLFAETLRLATGGKIDCLADPFPKLAARLPAVLSMVGAVYPTFADMSVEFADKPSALTVWLDKRMGWGLGLEPDGLTPLDDVGPLFAFHADDNPIVRDSLKSVLSPYTTFMPEAGVLISRAPHCAKPFALAVKGGNNAEEHNHNDVGSYCLFYGNDWLAVDPGAEEYTARTFGPKRYDSPVLNSFGHDVPRLGPGILQSCGSEFRGEVLEFTSTPERDFLRLQIREAYSFLPLISLIRPVETRRQGATAEVVIEDTFAYSTPEAFETAVIIFGTAERTADDTLAIHRISGDTVNLRVSASAAWTLSSEILDCKLNTPRYPRPTRLGIKLANPTVTGFVRLVYAS